MDGLHQGQLTDVVDQDGEAGASELRGDFREPRDAVLTEGDGIEYLERMRLDALLSSGI